MTSEMSDIYFCFGPKRGSYLLDTKKNIYRDGLPQEMSTILKKVRKVYYAAVDEYNSCVFAWKDTDGKVWHWEAPELSSRYPTLNNKLDNGKPDGVHAENMSVAFGPNSYVLCYYKINGAHWSGIHQQLKDSIKTKDRVRHVALGIDNCYVILYERTFTWAVSTRYPRLNGILREIDQTTTTITFIALNPWVAGEFFLVLDNDTVYYAVHSSLQGKIASILREEGIVSNGAVVPYNPTRTVATAPSVPNIRVKNGSFAKEMLGYTVGGVISGVAGAFATGMLSCTIM